MTELSTRTLRLFDEGVVASPVAAPTPSEQRNELFRARSTAELLWALAAATEKVLMGDFLPGPLALVLAGDVVTPVLLEQHAVTTPAVTFRVALPELVRSAGADLLAVRTVREVSAKLSVVSIDAIDQQRFLSMRAFLAVSGPRADRLGDWQKAGLADSFDQDASEVRRALAEVSTAAAHKRGRRLVSGPFWRTVSDGVLS